MDALTENLSFNCAHAKPDIVRTLTRLKWGKSKRRCWDWIEHTKLKRVLLCRKYSRIARGFSELLSIYHRSSISSGKKYNIYRTVSSLSIRGPCLPEFLYTLLIELVDVVKDHHTGQTKDADAFENNTHIQYIDNITM